MTDPHLATLADGSGTTVDYFGQRDTTGVTSRIEAATVTKSDGTKTNYQFDATGRPLSAQFSSGVDFQLQWTDNTHLVLTAVSPDKASAYTIPVTLSASPTGHSEPAGNPIANHVTSSPRAALLGPADVTVTSCHTRYPQDLATVVYTSSSGLSLPGSNGGSGNQYSTTLPSNTAASTNTPTDPWTAFQDQTAQICPWVTAASAVGGGLGLTIGVLQETFCTSLTVFAVPTTGAGAAAINAACNGFLDSLNLICQISTAASIIQSPNTPPPALLTVTATLLDGRTGTTTLSGPPYPGGTIDLPCNPVDHVTVTPNSSTLGLQQSSTLSAQAFNAQGGVILGSEAETNFSWESGAQTVASISIVGPPGPSSSATAKGLVNGQTTITALESNSRVSGTGIINVHGTATVTPSTVILDSIGERTQLSATVLDVNGNPIPGTNFNWTSSVPSIVTVGYTDGIVTAISPGTVTVSALDNVTGSLGQATVTVSPNTGCLTGTWQGTYSDAAGEYGTLIATFIQSGTTFTGSVTATGNQNSVYTGTSTSSISGTVTTGTGIQNLTFGPLNFGGAPATGVGTVSADCKSSSGSFHDPSGLNVGSYSITKQ